MRKRTPAAALLAATLSALTLATALIACNKGSGSDPEPGSKATADSSQAKPGSGARARDFETLDVCSFVPVAAVAEVLGHDPATGSAKATMGRYATDCTYSFEAGEGFSDYAMVWVYPPELWAPDMKTDIESVAGLGDRANLEAPTTPGSFARMNVLLEGELYVETRANKPEQARALAELALERLVGER